MRWLYFRSEIGREMVAVNLFLCGLGLAAIAMLMVGAPWWMVILGVGLVLILMACGD
jgi:hypothetical protein